MVMGLVVRHAVPILAPYEPLPTPRLPRRGSGYSPGRPPPPPAAPRMWEFYPITRPSLQRADTTPRRCRITDVDSQQMHSFFSFPSQPDFVLPRPPSSACPPQGHAARRGRGVSYSPLPYHPAFVLPSSPLLSHPGIGHLGGSTPLDVPFTLNSS